MDDEVFYPVDEATKILKPTPGRIRQMLREGSPEGFSLFSRATRMASKGLREASEGSSMGAWERTVQANHRRTKNA